MYRRHFVSAALTVALVFTSTVVVAVEASYASTPPPVHQPETVLASFELPMIPTTDISASPVVQAQKARTVLTQQSTAIKVAAYQAAVLASAQAAVRAAGMAEIAAAEKVVTNSMFACIRTAESGNNYGITSGAYGILISTWHAFSSVWSPFGSWEVPGQAPREIQDLMAYHLYKVGGGYGGWNNPCTA